MNDTPIKNIDWLTRWADHHHKRAHDGNLKWHARKAWLNEYCDKNNYTEDQRRTKFELDWELTDAMAQWSWNEREAKRLDSLIARECARASLRLAQEAQNARRVPSPRHPVDPRSPWTTEEAA